MPVYPGTNSPEFKRQCTIEVDGFNELNINMVSHTGTHVDVPAHIFKEGKSLSDLSIDNFAGSALVFYLNPKEQNCVEEIEKRISRFGVPDFFLFYTGWNKNWGRDLYFQGYPLPDEETINFIIDLRLKGVGIDTISIDPAENHDLDNHHLLLSEDIIIVENLTNLRELPEAVFDFFCMPLNIYGGDGGPARAFAIVND